MVQYDQLEPGRRYWRRCQWMVVECEAQTMSPGIVRAVPTDPTHGPFYSVGYFYAYDDVQEAMEAAQAYCRKQIDKWNDRLSIAGIPPQRHPRIV